MKTKAFVLSVLFVSQLGFAAPVTKLSPQAQEALEKAKACISIAHDAKVDPTKVCGDLLAVEGVLPAILDEMTVDPTECLKNAGNKHTADSGQCFRHVPAAQQPACLERAQTNLRYNQHLCMQAQQNGSNPVSTSLNLNIGTPSLKK